MEKHLQMYILSEQKKSISQKNSKIESGKIYYINGKNVQLKFQKSKIS